MSKVLIDIPMPENCENCLICSLVPEHARLELREKGLGLQYRLYCKVTGACVSGKGRDDACPLHERKTGRWIIDGHHIRCDQCGMDMCNTDREGDPIPKEFCPNCGAKMEGCGND